MKIEHCLLVCFLILTTPCLYKKPSMISIIKVLKYLDLNKRMKKLVLIGLMLATCTSISCGQAQNERVKILFLRFATNPSGRYTHTLFFCIENKSLDTIYLSKNQISVVVMNNDKIINDTAFSKGLAFPPPLGDKQFIVSECIDSKDVANEKRKMLSKFALNLFNTNFRGDNLSKVEKEDIIQFIQSNCIILFPKSKTNFEQIFRSKDFNMGYKVSAYITRNKPFLSFYDRNNRNIKIYNKN